MSTNEYADKMDFVNEFSLKMEENGHPRIFGQILGWLLICSPRQQSFNDIMENLNISKASVSNITRILLEVGLIERVRVTGERQIYFKLKEGALTDFMDRQIQNILEIKNILNRGLNLVQGLGEEESRRLERATQFYSFLSEEFPKLLEKFSSIQKKSL